MAERQVEYSELLTMLHKHIILEYGNLTKFIESDICKEGELAECVSNRGKFMCYLSIPRDGKRKVAKSVPTLTVLAKHLLGLDIRSELKVRRELKIYLSERGT